VPLKSIGHHNTGTGSKEVEEELMALAWAQDEQRFFYPTVMFVPM
jgi:hypothetical protein